METDWISAARGGETEEASRSEEPREVTNLRRPGVVSGWKNHGCIEFWGSRSPHPWNRGTSRSKSASAYTTRRTRRNDNHHDHKMRDKQSHICRRSLIAGRPLEPRDRIPSLGGLCQQRCRHSRSMRTSFVSYHSLHSPFTPSAYPEYTSPSTPPSFASILSWGPPAQSPSPATAAPLTRHRIIIARATPLLPRVRPLIGALVLQNPFSCRSRLFSSDSEPLPLRLDRNRSGLSLGLLHLAGLVPETSPVPPRVPIYFYLFCPPVIFFYPH